MQESGGGGRNPHEDRASTGDRSPNNLVRALLVHRDRADASTILAALTGAGEPIEAALLCVPEAWP